MLNDLAMVEQMGVEPTTYTMRTYRSSQLSYCPFRCFYIIYTIDGICQACFVKNYELSLQNRTQMHKFIMKVYLVFGLIHSISTGI